MNLMRRCKEGGACGCGMIPCLTPGQRLGRILCISTCRFIRSAALADGDLDANAFRHRPYLESQIATRVQDKDQPWVKKLVQAYHSEEVRKFIDTEFKGSLVPAF